MHSPFLSFVFCHVMIYQICNNITILVGLDLIKIIEKQVEDMNTFSSKFYLFLSVLSR